MCRFLLSCQIDWIGTKKKRSTRVYNFVNTVKLNLELKQQKKNREMIAIARGDLADSSDDDMVRHYL